MKRLEREAGRTLFYINMDRCHMFQVDGFRFSELRYCQSLFISLCTLHTHTHAQILPL